MEESQELIEKYNRARQKIRANPENAIAWAGLCEVCIKLGKKEEAVVAYERAVSLDPFYTVLERKLKEAGIHVEKREPAEMAVARRSFWGELPDAFGYPFRGSGIAIVIAGSIFISAIGFLMSYLFFPFVVAAPIIGILWLGYYFNYCTSIIQSTVQGKDTPPSWPEVSSVWDDMVAPAVKVIAFWILPFVPGVMAMVYGYIVLGIVLIIVALAYIPMGYLALCLLGFGEAFNLVRIFISIFKVFPAYFTLYLFLIALAILNSVAPAMIAGVIVFLMVMFPVPAIWTLVLHFMFALINMYYTMVMVRALGVLYRCYATRLRWF